MSSEEKTSSRKKLETLIESWQRSKIEFGSTNGPRSKTLSSPRKPLPQLQFMSKGDGMISKRVDNLHDFQDSTMDDDGYDYVGNWAQREDDDVAASFAYNSDDDESDEDDDDVDEDYYNVSVN